MKKLFLGVLFATAIALPAQAGMWEKLTSSGPTVPARVFKIEASGWNLRAYIFDVPGENKRCIFAAGSKKGGLTCWTKGKDSPKLFEKE